MTRIIRIVCALWATGAFGSFSAALQAQNYPSRPIQVVVPMGAGSGTDIHARILMEELRKILNTSIVVVNKPGAFMTVGTDAVAKARKDGYTLLYGPATGITYSKALEPETVPYDPIKDLEPLGLHAFFPVVIAVSASSPWKNLHDLVEDAKRNPGKIRVSTPGLQTTSSFNVIIIEGLTGARFLQVPYKDIVAGVTDMIGGQVEATTQSLSVIVPFAADGRVRILVTSRKVKEFPNVPVLNELGFKQELFSPWFAMYAPAGTPDEVIKVLVPAIKKAMESPEVVARINRIGGTLIEYKSPAELKKMAIDEIETISALAVKMGLRK
jgi:tripartite-type tricarboxylate transporter receptor subunit TctC